MSKLKDALDMDDKIVIENMVDNPASDPIIVKAARRVASPDYKAAWKLAGAAGLRIELHEMCDFVNAALHIDPPEET